MSFNIFVTGTAGTTANIKSFNYIKNDQPDDDTFDVIVVTSKLMTIVDANTAALAVVDFASPNVFEAVQDVGRQVSLRLLNDALTFLTMHGGAHGTITVFCEEENLLWGKTLKSAMFTITPKAKNPGAEFIRKVSPALKDTSLDSYGVLNEMARAVYAYQKAVKSKSLGIRLNIYLTKN
jgi:hypothetical protein